jgi:DNA-directed RNA polymerase subunit omega
VESRYELGMLASQRVRDLNGGADPVVEKRRDKPTVIALREIDAELENALIEEPVAIDETEEIADVASGDLSAEE